VKEHALLGGFLVVLIILPSCAILGRRSSSALRFDFGQRHVRAVYLRRFTLNTMTFGRARARHRHDRRRAIVVLENTQPASPDGKDRMTAGRRRHEEVWSRFSRQR